MSAQSLICAAITVYIFILFARVILSWVQAFGSRIPPALGPVAELIYNITEPVLRPLRGAIPPVGGLDLSVLVLFLVLSILSRVVCTGG
jgi:YggT family protein